MNWHPTGDDLVLQYYGEDGEPGFDAIAAHLRKCPTCRAASEELAATLGLVSRYSVPEPSSSFEHDLWTRVRNQMDVAPAVAGRRSARTFAIVGALAASLVAFAGGFLWVHSHGRPPAITGERAEPLGAGRGRERVLLTALDDHFSQTEMLLVELMNGPETDTKELTFERMTADDLVASGRLYRQTASQTGDRQFAELLDDLEGVLVEVARSPDPVDRADFRSLRTRIDTEGLLFKVRAVTSQVRNRQQLLLTQQ